jgi:ABC-type antimicrobial peptide transport system permease subunit
MRRLQDAIFYGLAILSGLLGGLTGMASGSWVNLILVAIPLVIAAVLRLRTRGLDRMSAILWLVVWIAAYAVAVLVAGAIT